MIYIVTYKYRKCDIVTIHISLTFPSAVATVFSLFPCLSFQWDIGIYCNELCALPNFEPNYRPRWGPWQYKFHTNMKSDKQGHHLWNISDLNYTTEIIWYLLEYRSFSNDSYQFHIPWWHHTMACKCFLHYWPFVRGIHHELVDSPHKGLVM